MPKINIHHHAVQKPNAVALSMQEAQWRRLETVTNNIANAQTAGFKQILLKLETTHHRNKTKGARAVNFVHANKQSRNMSDGSFRLTNNPLDVCLIGHGFFMVKNTKGSFYTRNGQFSRSADGYLVTANDGNQVLSQNGTQIIIPPETKNIHINSLGEVYVDTTFLAKIGTFKFNDLQKGLRNIGGSLYQPTDDNPAIAATTYHVKQGGIEESNVSAMEEGILMIKILREYENAQKIIDQDDQNKKTILNVSQKNA